MQRSLKLSLAITLLLTVAALWTGRDSAPAAPIDAHASVGAGAIRPDVEIASQREGATSHLSWGRSLLEPASRDLFASGIPTPQAPPVPVAAPVPAAPEVAAIPTPLPQYRFLGRMVTPEGQQKVYLGGQGEQAVAVKAGDRLDDGWMVDQLDQDAIHLVYPPTQQRMVVSIAPGDQ